MTFWLDAQLSPALAPWLAEQFGVEAHSVRQLGYRDAADRVIFEAVHAAMVWHTKREPECILRN
jgi:predicted nuclease of predicted toxin-antitoxin system